MVLVPLLPLFHSLNKDYFDSSLTKEFQPLVTLRWSDGRLRKTAGFYRCRKYRFGRHRSEIVLSRPLLQTLPLAAIESTLCHEMIHAWIDLVLKVKEGHGPNFHDRMVAINASQNRFKISVTHNFPVPPSKPKWTAMCPSCGLSFSYQRIVPNAACRKCCDRKHGGNWHSACLLIYKPTVF